MGTLCFSAASILRCESFTTLQSQLLIIPTALELIFSTTLIITNWGTGWRHLLLTAEGWSYFALALLELLSHTIPAVRDSVSVFSVVDIVLGATSFLPIFFYTLFVYLFTRGELIDTLPKRFQRIANTLLLVFIPAVVVLNEVSSFVGISRRTITLVGGRQVVAIGFQQFSDQQLWTFLTSLTLALLTAFEAINFCFAFYRLIRAFVDQRRIETTATDQAHLIRGIGWITGGFKLGAVETVIGFAQGGFGGALTRRIIRFLARAFLIIGIVKGVDQVDDFDIVTKEMSSGRQQFRRSRLGMLISNPRFSTFRQLSPTAKDFYNAPRAPTVSEKVAGPSGMTERVPDMNAFSEIKRDVTRTTASGLLRPQQRVTVQFERGAPTLHMRFSGLEMPSPAVIAESVKARPVSSSWVSIARSSRYAPSAEPSFAFDAPPVPMSYPEFIYERDQPSQVEAQEQKHARGMSQFSARSSAYPDSLNAVRELTSQFPLPKPSPIPEGSSWDTDVEAQQYTRRSWDDDRHDDSAYAPSAYTVPSTLRAGAGRGKERAVDPFTAGPSPVPEPVRYVYGGMEYPESPEPVYRYNYDGPVSPEHIHVPNHPYAYSPPVANPDAIDFYSPPAPQQNQTRHRNSNDETTASTPGTENPFQYDEDAPALNTGKSGLVYSFPQEVPEPVYMEDGPHSGGARLSAMPGDPRTSVALLQMTQRDNAGWAPAEFTPSMFSEPSTASSKRHTLKKRRPSMKSENMTAASVDTFASSWLHGDMGDGDADEERAALAGSVPMPVRVKSVGRVRAPRKATPAPVNAKHGMTRGSVYIQPIHVPPATYSHEVQIVQGGSSADSYNSEFADRP
ncbi:hypothetical protein C8F04DRAFT_1112696 [Mycena alexandri]|uniref:Uncharacterized protein n=1 Tax=Mycena alexandri TaxID=1745969 RepID=A0AAD6SP76_9AGAR|nr:hypothetical protein C8F04DRAFT_1112696 [Mycena alexandri]